MQIYLSLPISGYDLAERIAFAERATDALTTIFKCNVYNPLEDVTPDDNHTYEFHMGIDLAILADCDTVVFCDGFEQSHGCMIEYWFANYKEMTFLRMDNDLRVYHDKNIHGIEATGAHAPAFNSQQPTGACAPADNSKDRVI